MFRKKLAIAIVFSISNLAQAALPLGKIPPKIQLSQDAGGRIDGKPWLSSELSGKVHLLVYSSPGEKDLNNKATELIKKENYPKDQFASVAVVNMAASWLPNKLIESAIKSKQKSYPNTTYVKDLNKSLVKKWNLADNSNDIILFNQKGEVVFSVDGELNDQDIKNLNNKISSLIKS